MSLGVKGVTILPNPATRTQVAAVSSPGLVSTATGKDAQGAPSRAFHAYCAPLESRLFQVPMTSTSDSRSTISVTSQRAQYSMSMLLRI
jgi:hypothetical protein